jgi:CBS domain containing-hemolysin-like protein
MVIVLLLVLANGFFVAAEFAIVGAQRTIIEHHATKGNRLARRVAHILKSPVRVNRYIATTQLGITVTSLGLGMYGEYTLAEWLVGRLELLGITRLIAAHALASIVAIAVLTYLHIVLGEMVPKALALQRANRVVLYLSPVIEAIERALLPLIIGLEGIGNGLLRLAGVTSQETKAERYHSPEELQLIIEESQEGGMIRGESGRIVRELLEFSDLTAGQVMVPRVQTVGIPDGAVTNQLQAVIRSNPHTRYPVYTGDLDHISGSIHIKKLLQHLQSGLPVTAVEARTLPHVPQTSALDEVLAAMRRNRNQMAVVMDEHGGTAGLITIEDLFEEVVGEIEEGQARTPIVRDGTGRLMVLGTVRLKDAGEALGIGLEHPEVQSISGLVLALLGRPPVQGDSISWKNTRIRVTTVTGHGVRDATITLEKPGKHNSTHQRASKI